MSNSTSTPPDTSTPPTSLPPSSSPPPSSSSTTPTSTPPPTTTTTRPTTTSPTSRTTQTSQTTIVTTDPSGSTVTTIVTFTTTPPPNTTEPAPSTSSGPAAIEPGDGSSGGLNNAGKIAVAVVVPIAAVALLVLAGIFFWRKRKQRKDAEEQRRKEVEDYGYNPNADPTIPAVAGAGPYEMRDDNSSGGYRGWGSTTVGGSTGRKASTTMSGGAAGVAYSDATSPTRGGVSDTRSGDPLMNEGGSSPVPDGEILGAMGPSAANNRVDVHRGPSNASSSYSNAARSDGSGEAPIGAYGNQQYDQYGSGNPYADGPYNNRQGAAELGGQPVIRDVTARRNTRIENPAHYPQNAGISQNF